MSTNIVVPQMGESIVDARVGKWLKNEGDAVAVGEPLVELETDKVDIEVAAPQAGVLEKIAHPKGADVKIGEVLGTIGAGTSGTSGTSGTTGTTGTTGTAGTPPPPAPPTPKTPAAKPESAGRMTPSARRAAREQNIPVAAAPAAPAAPTAPVQPSPPKPPASNGGGLVSPKPTSPLVGEG